jgi:hypothetical protein
MQSSPGYAFPLREKAYIKGLYPLGWVTVKFDHIQAIYAEAGARPTRYKKTAEGVLCKSSRSVWFYSRDASTLEGCDIRGLKTFFRIFDGELYAFILFDHLTIPVLRSIENPSLLKSVFDRYSRRRTKRVIGTPPHKNRQQLGLLAIFHDAWCHTNHFTPNGWAAHTD